jgi:hypothetical protein
MQKIFKEMGNIACYLFLQSGLQQKKKINKIKTLDD